MHKEAESGGGGVSDHWARRRKLFKDSQQWSSAGGSSITSDVAEESGNSHSEAPSSIFTPTQSSTASTRLRFKVKKLIQTLCIVFFSSIRGNSLDGYDDSRQ